MDNSEEIKYRNSAEGKEVIILHGSIAMTVYSDKAYQVFHTEKGNYVFDKLAEKILSLTIEAWTKMVMRIERAIEYPDPIKP